MKRDVTFRPIADGDRETLYRLYASTRQDEMAVVPWSDEEKESFLRQQFEAQHQHYQEAFAGARFSMIECGGRPIGRVYLERREDEHRLIDIALFPEYRGKGLGRRLMQDILDEAAAAGKKVRIHVEHNNPAMRLYLRLGFVRVEDQGVYYLMEWIPPRS